MLFKKGDKCQWRILATHGKKIILNITSLNYHQSSSYVHILKQILKNLGEKIILNITSLNIPASANCQLDYLEVSFPLIVA